MCFKGPKVDNTALMWQQQEAAEARRREEERAARIRAGLTRIDEIFGGTRRVTGTAPRAATVNLSALVNPQTGQIDPARLGQYGFSMRAAPADAGPTVDNRGAPAGTPVQAGDDRGAPAGTPGVAGDTRGATGRQQLVDAAGNVVWTGDNDYRGLTGDSVLNYTANDPTYGEYEGGFDNRFFNARNQAVMDAYVPQLDSQFTRARDKLTFALARAGTLNSTVAGQEADRLGQENRVQFGAIQSRAKNEENALRTRVANEKASLEAQLNATGDADRASNEALARTQTIASDVPEYDSLGDIFSGFATGIGQAFQGQNEGRVLAAYSNNARRPASRTVTD